MFNDFLSQYGTTILYSILLALAGTLGKWIGGIYKKHVNNKTKREIAQVCVKAVEQLYKNLHGEEKYNKAVEAITEMLAVNGITITDIELKMLIEATCQEFVKTAKDKIEVVPDA